MGRFSAGYRATAGSPTLPFLSLYATASGRGRLREVGIFNTTTSAVEIALRRLSTAGTQGAGLTEASYDSNGVVPECNAFEAHTVGPTLGNILRRGVLGAAVGAGIIWTFGDSGILIPSGTANGIGLIVANGAGQITQCYMDWDE